MNDHQTVRVMLSLAAAGVLEERERGQVEKHLAECAVCRQEFESWNVYARGLERLPQPAVPRDLLLRTQARVLHAQSLRTERANTPLLVLGLSILGWGVSYLLWFVLQATAGGEVLILQTNLLRPGVWALSSAALAWSSGAVAALLLSRFRKDWREAL